MDKSLHPLATIGNYDRHNKQWDYNGITIYQHHPFLASHILGATLSFAWQIADRSVAQQGEHQFGILPWRQPKHGWLIRFILMGLI